MSPYSAGYGQRAGHLSGYQRTYISQGEQAIGHSPNDLITTVLGSCVSLCLWDPGQRVGGMNHMLLPEAASYRDNLSAGAVDIERLINAILRFGGQRNHLRAKVFGGASMLSGMTDIGARNAEFVLSFLQHEGITCDGASTGGDSARQLKFWPESGAVKQRLVRNAPVMHRPTELKTNDVELF